MGVSDLLFSKEQEGNHTNQQKILGIVLILLGMIFTSFQVRVNERSATALLIDCPLQVVYEERFIGKYNIPALQAVGWEGIFGFMTLGLILIPVNVKNVNSIVILCSD